MSPDSIDDAIATINARSTELESSELDDEIPDETPDIPETGEFLLGTFGDDLIEGGTGSDTLIGTGSDTLLGGLGDDFYSVGFTDTEAGTQIIDGGGTDDLLIVADNTDIGAVTTNLNSDSRSNSDLFGDSAIELSLPAVDTVGLQKSDTNLIIDLNRDGVAEGENDLTIFDFFNENGELGSGSIEKINNIIDSQDIVDLFANSSDNEPTTGSTVYRFFNTDTGVHFYTADETERDAVQDFENFNFEGASYNSVDPLSGTPLYRFLNQDTGVHLYTTSDVERDAVEELDNFSFEGEAFSAFATEMEGSIPIYRFFNSSSGAHFYTPSEVERDNVVANLSDFQSEGIAYYAFPSDL